MRQVAGLYRLSLLLCLLLGGLLAAAPIQARTRSKAKSSKSSAPAAKTARSTKSATARKSAAPTQDDGAPARKTSSSRRKASSDNSESSFDGWRAAVESAERSLGESWTAVIEDLSTTETIFEYHGNERLVPASNRKIITCGMALENLGPDYQFQTEFGLSAPVDPGRAHYHGDVILRSNGDPSLTDPFLKSGRNPAEIFKTWAKTLKDSGITNIYGNLIIDASAFGETQNSYPLETWGPNHRNQTYAPIPSAITMGQNLMRITVSPSRAGSPCHVSIFPADEGITVINNTRSSGRRRGLTTVYNEDSKSLELEGSVGSVQVDSIPIPHPLNYIGQLMRNSLAEEGITFTGSLDIRTSLSLPGTAPVIVQRMGTHESPPLVQMIYLMMQQSNNFLAEQLWRAAAARAKGCGDITRARQAEAEWYLRHGLTITEPGWDGSGLSRMDKFSAREMAAISRGIFNTAYQGVFLTVLPTAGKSGTLRRRTSGTMDHRVTAKTGTLAGVSSLSGFIKDSQGCPRFVFSVIGNATRDTNGRLANRINSLMNIAIHKLDEDIAAGRRPAVGPAPPPGAANYDYELSRSNLYAGSADFFGSEAERMGAEQEQRIAAADNATSATAAAVAAAPAVIENGLGEGR